MSKGYSATSVEDVQDAKKQLQRLLKKCDTVPTQVLKEEAPKLYAEIISRVPYRTGKLERSVKVTISKDKRRPGLNASASARSASGYDYSGIQHEDETFNHPIKGEAHYISGPFEEAVARIEEKLRDRMEV